MAFVAANANFVFVKQSFFEQSPLKPSENQDQTISKSALPNIVKRTVAMPVRPKTPMPRTREYLTDDEVPALGRGGQSRQLISILHKAYR